MNGSWLCDLQKIRPSLTPLGPGRAALRAERLGRQKAAPPAYAIATLRPGRASIQGSDDAATDRSSLVLVHAGGGGRAPVRGAGETEAGAQRRGRFRRDAESA